MARINRGWQNRSSEANNAKFDDVPTRHAPPRPAPLRSLDMRASFSEQTRQCVSDTESGPAQVGHCSQSIFMHLLLHISVMLTSFEECSIEHESDGRHARASTPVTCGSTSTSMQPSYQHRIASSAWLLIAAIALHRGTVFDSEAQHQTVQHDAAPTAAAASDWHCSIAAVYGQVPSHAHDKLPTISQYDFAHSSTLSEALSRRKQAATRAAQPRLPRRSESKQSHRHQAMRLHAVSDSDSTPSSRYPHEQPTETHSKHEDDTVSHSHAALPVHHSFDRAPLLAPSEGHENPSQIHDSNRLEYIDYYLLDFDPLKFQNLTSDRYFDLRTAHSLDARQTPDKTLPLGALTASLHRTIPLTQRQIDYWFRELEIAVQIEWSIPLIFIDAHSFDATSNEDVAPVQAFAHLFSSSGDGLEHYPLTLMEYENVGEVRVRHDIVDESWRIHARRLDALDERFDSAVVDRPDDTFVSSDKNHVSAALHQIIVDADRASRNEKKPRQSKRDRAAQDALHALKSIVPVSGAGKATVRLRLKVGDLDLHSEMTHRLHIELKCDGRAVANVNVHLNFVTKWNLLALPVQLQVRSEYGPSLPSHLLQEVQRLDQDSEKTEELKSALALRAERYIIAKAHRWHELQHQMLLHAAPIYRLLPHLVRLRHTVIQCPYRVADAAGRFIQKSEVKQAARLLDAVRRQCQHWLLLAFNAAYEKAVEMTKHAHTHVTRQIAAHQQRKREKQQQRRRTQDRGPMYQPTNTIDTDHEAASHVSKTADEQSVKIDHDAHSNQQRKQP